MNSFIPTLFSRSNITARRFVTLVAILFFQVAVMAQRQKIDSLDKLIANAKTDTDRIRLNIKKINILSRKSLDTAIFLSKLELQKAEKAYFYDGIFILHTQLANNYIFKGNYDSAKMNIQFLEKIVKPADSSNISTIYSIYGMLYGVQASYDSSIKFYEKAIVVDERLNNTRSLTNDYANVAIGYQQLANFPKALEYQQRSLQLAEANNNEELRAKTLLNIGITYEEIGDVQKAEQYYLEAKDIAVKNEYKIIELYDDTNLSSMYIKLENWSKGYDYAMKAADLSVSTGDVGIKGASLAKAALALAHQNKFEEATALSKQAIQLADSSTQPLNISQAYDALAKTLFLQKKYAEAIPYFEKEFKALNGAANYDEAYASSYKNLSECYEKTGDNVKALANYKMSAEIADSIKRKDNIRKATELGMNYDFAKKQEVLNAEKKRNDEVAATKQKALIVGLLLVLTLAIVAFRGYRNKQKANNLITLQKQQVETTLSELKATQAQLIQSEKMASLGELTAGIAHEIQNPLNFVTNFSEVNKELIEELKIKNAKLKIEDEEVNELLNDIKANEEKINHHGKRADAIVKGMLQHSRKDAGVKELTDINALCDEYVRLSYHGLRAKDKSFQADYQTDFDESIGKINIVSQDVGRVLLNLVNNAFYAVNEKKGSGMGYQPTVSVSTKKTGNSVAITVSDNGNGIPQSIVDKIFQPFFTTKPTGQGTGLGLSLSYDIIKAHGGDIQVETKEGEGTVFIIHLPF